MPDTDAEARQGLSLTLALKMTSRATGAVAARLAKPVRGALLVGGAIALGAFTSGQAAASEGGEDAPSGAPLVAPASFEPGSDLRPTQASMEEPRVMRLRARIQCVPYAREQSGVALRGDANTWWRQAAGKFERTQAPSDGAVIVMRGFNNPGRGHVAVVRQVLSERSILIDHANWLNSGEVTLNVPVVDVSQNNDWSEVRVWHIPTQAWGARVYNVQGFILPDAAGQTGASPTLTAR